MADRDGDDAALLGRLATAKRLLQRAVAEGDVGTGIAAAIARPGVNETWPSVTGTRPP